MSDIARTELSDLLARTALRDRSSFTKLYERTSAKLFGVLLRILKDQSEAEEALQEVYVKIWRKAEKFRDGQYSPISWLVAIARNHALDLLRARKPHTEDIDEVLDLASSAPNPEQAAMGMEEQGRIEGCLGELETERADAVRGAYLDGYSYQELAERYDVPLNTMRTWLRRSLMKLKDCLTA